MLTLTTPTADELGPIVRELSSWQQDGLPIQLHPGDLGWQWRFGPTALANAIRVWSNKQKIVAIGFVDGESLIRMAMTPLADRDEELARALVHDLEDPTRGVLTTSKLIVEARFGTAFRSLFHQHGWTDDEPWTPLIHDLRGSVQAHGLRVEIVGPDHIAERVAVQRSAFDNSTFTTELWNVMAQSPAYRHARCLVGYDNQDNAVAAITVWSAGKGRPGLVEPMGVHRDHRGHGYGTAISAAGASALRDMGASSALVVTASANVGAVATYAAAGFRRMPEVTDFAYSR